MKWQQNLGVMGLLMGICLVFSSCYYGYYRGPGPRYGGPRYRAHYNHGHHYGHYKGGNGHHGHGNGHYRR